ncbi:MAG: sterol desaturase family protein [Bacteroidia bacterium]|nr:sterol desaturase family protein [Bacteroidia bacterium]
MENISANTVYAVGLPIAFFLILLEAIYSAWKKRGYYNWGDSWGTWGLFLGNTLMILFTRALIFAFYLFLYQFCLFDLKLYLPTWAVWLFSFFLIDFTFYWFHRASHRSRFLWAIHMNHHSSEEMNFLVAFRQAWFGPLAKVPFFLFLPLLFLDPTITIVSGAIATLVGVLGHTRTVPKLGPLEWIFNTPSHHRVHHGSNPDYIDKNYGNLFIIWDRMFGTFAEEKEAVVYGLTKNVNTFNPWKITFMEWVALWRDIKQAKNWKQGLQHIWKAPDWQAEQEKR